MFFSEGIKLDAKMLLVILKDFRYTVSSVYDFCSETYNMPLSLVHR